MNKKIIYGIVIVLVIGFIGSMSSQNSNSISNDEDSDIVYENYSSTDYVTESDTDISSDNKQTTNQWWIKYENTTWEKERDMSYSSDGPETINVIGFTNGGEKLTIEYEEEVIECNYDPQSEVFREYYPTNSDAFHYLRLYRASLDPQQKNQSSITIYPKEPHHDPYFDVHTNMEWISYIYNY